MAVVEISATEACDFDRRVSAVYLAMVEALPVDEEYAVILTALNNVQQTMIGHWAKWSLTR